MNSRAQLLLVILLIAPTSALAQAASAAVTIEALAAQAAEQSLDVAQAEEALVGAEEALSSARTLYGPRLMVEGSAMGFNEPPTATFNIPTPPGVPLAGPMDMGEQYVVDLTVTLAQPLTGLVKIRQLNAI